MKKSKLLVSAALAATILGSQAALADNHEKKKEESKEATKSAEKSTKEATASKDGANGCGANGCQAAHKTEEQKKK